MDKESSTPAERKTGFATYLSLSVTVCEIALLVICVVGDRLQHFELFVDKTWNRAMLDNVTHGLIAFFSWAIYIDFSFQTWPVLQCVLCAFMAMILDIDHFMAAKTLSIDGATSLAKRPPFHATTIIPVIAGLIYWVSRNLYMSEVLRRFAVIFTLAWLSHHIRDSTRRGLWFWPVGSTPPLPYWLYVTLTLTLPLVFRIVSILYTLMFTDQTTIDNEADVMASV